jgi:murein DD-endopeptidase MepM/ murein hydrolase activator NlpD
VLRFAILVAVVLPLQAASVRRAAVGTSIREEACAVVKPATSFRPVERQIFVAVMADRITAGDDLRIDWVNPQGATELAAPYTDLPAAQPLCFISQLPVSGFPASSNAGTWTVRAVSRERVLWSQTFRMEADGSGDALRITNVTRTAAGAESELTIDGAGFDSSSIVHVAEYRKDGGWQYIHSVLASGGTANRLTAKIPALAPGEYLALVRNGGGLTSKPSRFLVTTGGTYHLPIAGGEHWIITQGPYGTFSHWHNSLHAYDIAPRGGKWVTAMRGGIAFTHDLGIRQSHTRRTFGNYITIQHENGEFSHYAHLAAGTFLVKNGEQVQAGQALARVGNSGYTLGEGGGYHVHVHVTRTQPVSSPSIPFKFDELSQLAVTKLRGLEVTSDAPPVPAEVARRASQPDGASQGGKVITGRVQVASTWTDVLQMPEKAKAVTAELTWNGSDRDLDLHLVAPSGHHYGWYGDTTGYSGQKSSPERFVVEHPEPGPWRVMVAGMAGTGEAIDFQLRIGMDVAAPAPPRRHRGRSAAVRNAWQRSKR